MLQLHYIPVLSSVYSLAVECDLQWDCEWNAANSPEPVPQHTSPHAAFHPTSCLEQEWIQFLHHGPRIWFSQLRSSFPVCCKPTAISSSTKVLGTVLFTNLHQFITETNRIETICITLTMQNSLSETHSCQLTIIANYRITTKSGNCTAKILG